MLGDQNTTHIAASVRCVVCYDAQSIPAEFPRSIRGFVLGKGTLSKFPTTIAVFYAESRFTEQIRESCHGIRVVHVLRRS